MWRGLRSYLVRIAAIASSRTFLTGGTVAEAISPIPAAARALNDFGIGFGDSVYARAFTTRPLLVTAISTLAAAVSKALQAR